MRYLIGLLILAAPTAILIGGAGLVFLALVARDAVVGVLLP